MMLTNLIPVSLMLIGFADLVNQNQLKVKRAYKYFTHVNLASWVFKASGGSSVVEHPSTNPKIEGLNPPTV